ncbi:uncharacterized protein ACOB8E_000589 isoform 1-T1 [Sarcophilus harrisii]
MRGTGQTGSASRGGGGVAHRPGAPPAPAGMRGLAPGSRRRRSGARDLRSRLPVPRATAPAPPGVRRSSAQSDGVAVTSSPRAARTPAGSRLRGHWWGRVPRPRAGWEGARVCAAGPGPATDGGPAPHPEGGLGRPRPGLCDPRSHPGRVTMMTAKPKRIKFSEEERCDPGRVQPAQGHPHPQDWPLPQHDGPAAGLGGDHDGVNSLNPLVQRTPEEVRKKWKNMILDARKELATAKHPLLRRRPQERLFHNIFALFNKTGSELPEPLYAAGPGFRTKGPPSPSEPACKVEGFLDPGLVLRPQGAAMEPGQEREGLCQIEVSRKLDSWPEVSGKSLLPSPVDVQARFKEDALTEDASDYGEKRLLDPLKDLPLHCEPVAQVHPAAAGGAVSPEGPPGDLPHLCTMPVPASPSPDPALTYKIKCPVSPLLDWPCLAVSASPVTPSGRLDPLSTEGIHTAMTDNVSASVVTAEEDLLPGPRPSEEGLPEKDSGEVAKQSRLQTEILELQKETLQLQKEKILLEKEKLVLEIVKLRRELGT